MSARKPTNCSQHKLKITSLHDAQASCSCGWSLVHTGKLTRAEIRAKWWSHKRAVAALTFCIIPGCTGTKLEGRKYCAAHQERANGQTLAEKVTEQRHAHASRAEERICEAEQEAIANGDADQDHYYVDIPDADCIGNPDGAYKNVATFHTHAEALAFAVEHFGTDAQGRVSLVTPGPQAQEPRGFDPLKCPNLAVLRDVAAMLPVAARLHPDDMFKLQTRVTAVIAEAEKPAQAQESKTWTPEQIAAIQPQERQNIISGLRAAAMAIAELWDTLHEIEEEHGCQIEMTDDLLNCLAGEYKTPAGFADLPEAIVWENFTQQSHTDLTYYTAAEAESDMERDRRG